MVELVEMSLPALLCALVLLAASILLNFRPFARRIALAFKINLPTRSAPGTSAIQAQKWPPLPQGWWTDTSGFQLERRAIFSQTWVCVSHRGRFANPGDYVSHEMVGFRFFLILGKDGTVRAFHNVCRHRAFPVTPKASGSSTILGCKYHGWCYNTKGQLTKAPQFDDIPGFDKSLNGLFEIYTKVDSHGFIHINLSGSPEACNTQLSAAKKTGAPSRISHDSRLVHSWEMKGRFNWKVILDHVQNGGLTTQDPFPASDGQLSFFPVTTVHTKTSNPYWYQLTYCPESIQQTTLRCDVYSSKNSSPAKIEADIKANLESRIKAVVEYYEERYATLSSSKDNADGIGDDQARISLAVKTHREHEAIEGKEINPATVQQQRSPAFTQAEELCQKVECGLEKLDW